jgi:hypothetical protein
MDGFWMLNPEYRVDPTVWTDLKAEEVDADNVEIIFGLDVYLRRDEDIVISVQLVCRKPKKRLNRISNRSPCFNKWPLLAPHNHKVWVHPMHKYPFFKQLNKHHVAEPGPCPYQASTGCQVLSCVEFITYLQDAGC